MLEAIKFLPAQRLEGRCDYLAAHKRYKHSFLPAQRLEGRCDSIKCVHQIANFISTRATARRPLRQGVVLAWFGVVGFYPRNGSKAVATCRPTRRAPRRGFYPRNGSKAVATETAVPWHRRNARFYPRNGSKAVATCIPCCFNSRQNCFYPRNGSKAVATPRTLRAK